MNILSVLIFCAVAAAVLGMPRRLVIVPFLFGSIYLTNTLGIEIGAIRMPAYRLLLVIGLVRVLLRGERFSGGVETVDKLVMAWGIWMLFASLFHEQEPGSGVVYAVGSVFTLVTNYFLFRIWCGDVKAVTVAVSVLAFLLAPVALEMFNEKLTGRNLFSLFGGVPESVGVRGGERRAQGPFRHPILAGTAGAAVLPLMISLWNRHRMAAVVGTGSCLLMVYASRSSGPLVSAMMGLAFVAAWKYRAYSRFVVWSVVAAYFTIEIISASPAYKAIVTRLDFTGSSTARYRAKLIETTANHFSEWWLFGTDHTSHWIQSGVGSVILGGRHMDITNYYITFGVNGGLASMAIIIVIILTSLRRTIILSNQQNQSGSLESGFRIWCCGAGMFSLALSGLSVAFYDQSVNLFWFSVAMISSLKMEETAQTPLVNQSKDRLESLKSVPENPMLV